MSVIRIKTELARMQVTVPAALKTALEKVRKRAAAAGGVVEVDRAIARAIEWVVKSATAELDALGVPAAAGASDSHVSIGQAG